MHFFVAAVGQAGNPHCRVVIGERERETKRERIAGEEVRGGGGRAVRKSGVGGGGGGGSKYMLPGTLCVTRVAPPSDTRRHTQ